MTTNLPSGLRLDQAPPLSIPLSFFLTAPVFLLASGLVLAVAGASVVLSRYMLVTIAVTHLGTLGVLAMIMFGALYQMTPVVAASPVPAIRVARVVHVALVVGIVSLTWGLFVRERILLYAAFTGICVALLGFALPVGFSLVRSPARRDAAVLGMLLAVVSLLLTGTLGVWIAHGHAGMAFPGPRTLLMSVHLGLGLLGWVGALIVAVSFQVLPMFYLTPQVPRGAALALLAAIGSLLVAAPIVLAFALSSDHRLLSFALHYGSLALAPAALSVWIVHPTLTLRAIARRRRKRSDATLGFFRLGLALAPLTFLLSVAVRLSDDPRLELAFGWLAIWGWAALIAHGMLYRIVPFLVWFHRFSPLLGSVFVPSAEKLVSAGARTQGLVLHASALGLGLLAIALRSDLFTRLTGVLLALTALRLGATLLSLARRQPDATEPSQRGSASRSASAK